MRSQLLDDISERLDNCKLTANRELRIDPQLYFWLKDLVTVLRRMETTLYGTGERVTVKEGEPWDDGSEDYL